MVDPHESIHTHGLRLSTATPAVAEVLTDVCFRLKSRWIQVRRRYSTEGKHSPACSSPQALIPKSRKRGCRLVRQARDHGDIPIFGRSRRPRGSGMGGFCPRSSVSYTMTIHCRYNSIKYQCMCPPPGRELDRAESKRHAPQK